MYDPKIVELVKASRAMLNGKNWHEIDGSCSICMRFREAVEVAENAAIQSVQAAVEACSPDRHVYYTAFLSYVFCPYCGERIHSG